MELIAYLIVLALVGLVIGAFGRLAIPGPDPMSIWMTMAIGVGASWLAGLATWAITGDRNGGGFLIAVIFAAIIVYLIRRSRGGTLTDPGITYRR